MIGKNYYDNLQYFYLIENYYVIEYNLIRENLMKYRGII